MYIDNITSNGVTLNSAGKSMQIEVYEKRIKELEEENKTLKELNVCVGCDNNPDYKTRINKAIEFIKDNASYDEDINRCVDDLIYNECDELLKILKGEK